MDQFIYVITGTIIAATPLIYAGLGELVVEKSGVLNLGIEGMMLIGAVVAFYFVKAGYAHSVAVLAALVAGSASSLLFGVLALTFLTNQYAAGLALAIFGSGVSGSVGRNFGSAPINALKPIHIPVLSDVPMLGPLLFSFDYLVYLGFVAVALVTWVLYRTKTGLIIRTLGESPQSAHAIGYPVIRIRYLTTLFGGRWRERAGPIYRSPTRRFGCRT